MIGVDVSSRRAPRRPPILQDWRSRAAAWSPDERLIVAAHLMANGDDTTAACIIGDDVPLEAVRSAVERLTWPRDRRVAHRDGMLRVMAALGRSDVSAPPVLPPLARELTADDGLAAIYGQGLCAAALNLGDARRPTDTDGAEAWDAGARRFADILDTFNRGTRA